jgi:hypothetical protein
VLQRGDRCRGGVVEVDPREHPAAVADDRELALSHRLHQAVAFVSVEDAVAQHDAAEVRDRLFEVVHRGPRLAHRRRRVRIEWIVLGLDHAALTDAPVGGEALGHEPAHSRLAAGGDQRVGSLGSKPVRQHEGLIQVPGELRVRQGGRLVDDRVGRGAEDGLPDGLGVEQVEQDRLRAQLAHPVGARGRGRGADHLVTALDQLGYEPGADGAARARYKDSHGSPFVTSASFRGSTAMTPSDGGM